MPKQRKSNTGLVAGMSWRSILLYAALLAGGTLILQWLDMTSYTRLHSPELLIGLIAALFLGLGIWPGARLFAGRPARTENEPAGNPLAQATLGITEREMEVLALLADGLANKEIANRLHVSPNTVKTHIARLLEKLDARRRTEAISRARELGLIE